jgi:GDPmannose 4,6-dehydratase
LKKALITGIAGQDGSYLTELLLSKGYEVHGIVRRSSTFTTDRIDHLYVDPHAPHAMLKLHYGDLGDATCLKRVLEAVEPDEVYNLGAQSHVAVSFQLPEYTADVDGLGVLRLLECIRDFKQTRGKEVKIYQAGTSEMFGAAPAPQSEETRFHPRSPYAVAKVYAHYQIINHREAYGIFAANGILFNHESERRGETFVTRKITRAATRIKLGLQPKLYLGNIDSIRDWGHAQDYVEAMWLILQHHEPDDFVVATGESRTVREFLDEVFGRLDLTWQDYVEIDPRYMRPAEVEDLQGISDKARNVLGWKPKISFSQLVDRMVANDLRLAEQERDLREGGHSLVLRGAATQ